MARKADKRARGLEEALSSDQLFAFQKSLGEFGQAVRSAVGQAARLFEVANQQRLFDPARSGFQKAFAADGEMLSSGT